MKAIEDLAIPAVENVLREPARTEPTVNLACDTVDQYIDDNVPVTEITNVPDLDIVKETLLYSDNLIPPDIPPESQSNTDFEELSINAEQAVSQDEIMGMLIVITLFKIIYENENEYFFL